MDSGLLVEYGIRSSTHGLNVSLHLHIGLLEHLKALNRKVVPLSSCEIILRMVG